MKTRIVKSVNQNIEWFTPQWSIDGKMWLEFYGYDAHSPYVHMKSFRTLDSAAAFLKNPSVIDGGVIWSSP